MLIHSSTSIHVNSVSEPSTVSFGPVYSFLAHSVGCVKPSSPKGQRFPRSFKLRHPIWGIPLRAFLDLKFHSHPSGSTYRAILSPHCLFARLDRGGAAASSLLKPRMNLETKVHQRSKHKQTPAQCRAPGTLQQGQGTTPHRTIRTSGTPSSLLSNWKYHLLLD